MRTRSRAGISTKEEGAVRWQAQPEAERDEWIWPPEAERESDSSATHGILYSKGRDSAHLPPNGRGFDSRRHYRENLWLRSTLESVAQELERMAARGQGDTRMLPGRARR